MSTTDILQAMADAEQALRADVAEHGQLETGPEILGDVQVLRDKILRLTAPGMRIVGEFETNGARPEHPKGKVILFRRSDDSEFIGFSGLSPKAVEELKLRTPFTNTIGSVGFASWDDPRFPNKDMGAFVGSKINKKLQ